MLVRNLLLALLLASPLSAQVTITGMTLEDVTITAAADTAPAEDWSAYFQAEYGFEASGDPWANNADSIGGSGCDMAIQAGTPTRDITTYKVGVASVYITHSDGAPYDQLQDASQCDELTADLIDSTITWGAWVYPETDHFGGIIGNEQSSAGYGMRRGVTNDNIHCLVGGGTSDTPHLGDANEFLEDEWSHQVCVYDHSAQELDSYSGGVASAVSATSATDGLNVRNPFIGRVTGTSFDRYIDEAWVYAGDLGAVNICRVCSCGVSGAGCTCSGTAWVDEGLNDSDCGSCTLPTNCNDASP